MTAESNTNKPEAAYEKGKEEKDLVESKLSQAEKHGICLSPRHSVAAVLFW